MHSRPLSLAGEQAVKQESREKAAGSDQDGLCAVAWHRNAERGGQALGCSSTAASSSVSHLGCAGH